MRLFKEKLAWAAPIAVILIIALFSLNLFAQGDPKVKGLPVALIANDESAHAEAVVSAARQLEPTLAFTAVNGEDIDGRFRDKEFYAALVIPEGYGDALENALTTGSPATLGIYINQGMNVTGANAAKTALTALVAQLSAQYSSGLMAQWEGRSVDASLAPVLVHPIVAQEQVFNAVTAATANGSAPTLMAVPAWVGALIGGFIVFLATLNILRQRPMRRRDILFLIGGQTAYGVVIALFSGFTVATLGLLAGINMPGYLPVALFVSFAAFCFYMLVMAVTAWIGKPAITLFMVVMLLGMGVLMTPKEMLPSFFVDFIRPWIPLRFASEGLREIFYFGSGFYTGSSFDTILGIGIGGFLLLVLSAFKPARPAFSPQPSPAAQSAQPVRARAQD